MYTHIAGLARREVTVP